MRSFESSSLLLGAGICLLAVAAALGYLGAPAYVTSVDVVAPDKQGLMNETAYDDPAEIEVHAYSNLSAAERAAFDGARQSSRNRQVDRWAADSGSTFEYRNDVTNSYVVRYEGRLYLVRVVTDVGYVALALAALSGLVGLAVTAVGGWRWHRSRPP